MPFRDLLGVTQCRFKKGEKLIVAGEEIEYIYYLIKGTVYRELVTAKGYEGIFACKKSEDIADALVGILSLYNKTGSVGSRYDFVAHTDCICYRIPKDVCMEYLRNHPALLESVLVHAVREHAKMTQLFLARREGTATSQLCSILLQRAKETENGLVVPRKLTNVEISKLISVHKVTVSRMLRALREEGTVERTADGLLILQPERLRHYAENIAILEYE